MLSFGNTRCAAQISAQPKSSFLFYEKLNTYVSLIVSAHNFTVNNYYFGVKRKKSYLYSILEIPGKF